MLLGEPIPNPEGSRFSKADSLAWLEEVFAAAAHIPVWGITYGGPTTDLQELADLVGKYRSRVEARAKGYTHLAALASDTNKAKNVELLLTGWK